jgi:hypothetical protein
MLNIIVPTLGNRLPELKRLLDSLEQQTNKSFMVICAIQGNYNSVQNLLSNYSFEVRTCFLERKGLSLARNTSINLIDNKAKYITFSDDDCWYPNFMVEKILSMNNLGNECYCFQIFDPNNNVFYKNYYKKQISKLTYRNSLKVSSIEFFVPSEVFNKNINFDENFGLGTKYPSGEENIFLFDLIKNGYILKYEPSIIVYHKFPNWVNKEYIFKGKGALFSRLYSPKIAFFLIIVYSIYKIKFFTNFSKQFKMMFLEIINYR